jgi:undecaprenyl-diphosphatase
MILTAILLGLLEGITEFLPVSSTGHLILASDLMGLNTPTNKTFDIVIQLGAIFAICWLYRDKLMVTATGMAQRNPRDWRFAVAVLLGFLPAAVVGALIHDFIKSALFNPAVVIAATILGGVVLVLVDRFRPRAHLDDIDTLPLPVCLLIGVFQCLAMIPGTSRSGATIVGAMLLGVERKTAAEYSFFVAIPTMFGATAYDLFKSRHDLTMDGAVMIAVGFVAAFVSALFVVRAFVAYISGHGFAPFGWYRIALGVVMLGILVAG